MSTTTVRRPTATRERSSVAGCPAGEWLIDADASNLRIAVKFGLFATVNGRFTDVDGTVRVAADVCESRIAVQVATSSLTSGSSHWDAVLREAGVVDSVANPTIGFEAAGLHSAGSGYLLSGILVTAQGWVELTLTVQPPDADPDTEQLRFRATGTLATRDAVRLLSKPGVDRLLGRTMTIDLTVVAVRAR